MTVEALDAVALHHISAIAIAFFILAVIALARINSLNRKVKHMTPAMTAMVQALADLQTAFEALEKRISAPVVPAMPADDEAAATAATATMTTLKGQVEALAPAS